ncbi:MAG: hypothetical protein WDO73_32100, partial [Ignavibacteriota bacterium]
MPQFGGSFGGREPVGVGIAKLFHPAHKLKIAESAGSLLHVGLEMIEGVGVLGMAFAGEADEVAHQSVAIILNESREPLADVCEERTVAGEEALVEQADVQLGILVVNFEALVGSAH